MPRDRSRSPADRDRRRRSREREQNRERRHRRDRSRSPDINKSPRRGRDRRERDVTPVYESRTGLPTGSGASSSFTTNPATSGDNSISTGGTEKGELLWDRERERIKKKEKEKEIAAKMAMPSGSGKKLTDQDLIGKSEEEIEMMRIMGFGSFDTTKNTKVKGNASGAVHVLVKRKYRQYMNRKGGFNRPLDYTL